MANIKITDLTVYTDPATTDVVPIVDVGNDTTKKVSVGEVVGKISGDVDVATDGTSSIAAGVIVDADINANAEIAVSKLADGAARQLLQTDAAGTGVEWTDNVDVPGTLDVTGATTLDSTLDVDGQSTLASAAVSDLTEDRVIIAGASGELEDSGNLTFDGSELGVTGTLDVSSDATVGGDLTVTGDLTVEGTTTTIETTTLLVEDKNIEMGVVDTPTDTTADGGGITLKGATDKTINWVNATDAWTSSEPLDLPAGTDAAPSLFFNGDVNTGIYSPGADQVAISTNGTGRLFVDASGRVGIGATPQSELQVNASDAISVIQLTNSTTGATNADGVWLYNNGVDATLSNLETGYLRFETAGSERLRITSDGKVGLGTSSPGAPLDLGGATNKEQIRFATPAIFNCGIHTGQATNIGDIVGQIGLQWSSSKLAFINFHRGASNNDGAISFTSGANTERMRINSSGNVGIGTTSPGALLDVYASSGDNLCRIGSVGSTKSGFQFRAGNTNYGEIYFHNSNPYPLVLGTKAGAGPVVFNVTDTERARITSSGQFLVGTSTARSDFSAGTIVQLEGVGSGVARYAAISNNNLAADGAGFYFARSRGTSNGSNTIVLNNDALGGLFFHGADGTDLASRAGSIECEVDGTPGANDMPGRLVFSTTADGASSPTERMRINSNGLITTTGSTTQGDEIFQFQGGSVGALRVFKVNSVGNSTTEAAVWIRKNSSTDRSINAAGTVNASGADYAEYMTKAGDFTIAKGDICGIDPNGKLTNVFANAVGFVVKSTDPSYVGSDSWGADIEDPVQLETERQKVDRIAFAGQVPVNVIGAIPGQYIIPVEDNGGISGIAKYEADLTLAEYMRAVGKVIAIEDDGRARIIVKVA